MQPRVYLYANHEPEERFGVRAIESDKHDSWVLIELAGPHPGGFQLGMTPDQARDLARELTVKAFDAELMDRAIVMRS